MKILCALLLITLANVRANAQQTASDPKHQWVDLALHDGNHALCDLGQASRVSFLGNRVTVDGIFRDKEGSYITYLFEDNPGVAQAVSKAVQSLPQRWLPIGDDPSPAATDRKFINLDAVVAVYFGTDGEGPFARALLRSDSVMRTYINSKAPDPGHLVRDSKSIERLQNLAKLP